MVIRHLWCATLAVQSTTCVATPFHCATAAAPVRFGNARVAEFVDWLSEQKKDANTTGEKRGWEIRNKDYLDRMREAPSEVLALSCADKTANMVDMLCHIPQKLTKRFDEVLQEFRRSAA